MKKKVLIVISIISSLILIGGIFVSAYYTFFHDLKGSEIVLENVKFQVNDSPNKGEEDTVYFTTDDLINGDGYQINIKYSLNGTFVSNYAMQYKTYFEINDSNNISSAIDVYRFYDDNYHYIGKLSSLLYDETDEANSAIYTDFLGVTGSHTEKFLLIYSMGNILDDDGSFGLKISTKSEMISTTATEFPYFYLDNMGSTGDDDSNVETVESIFKQLPDNELIYGRTIVLMRDIIYPASTNITFNNLVGIDLNGHSINLVGGTLTLADANETNAINYNSKIGVYDSVGGGALDNTKLKVNYSKSVIDIDTDFYSDNTNKLKNGSNITIQSISMDAFTKAAKEKFATITQSKHTVNSGSYTFDLFGNIKYYLLNESISLETNNIAVSSARGEAEATLNADKTITISNVTNSDSISLTITSTGFNSQSQVNDILQLYGSTTDSCKEYLESYIPKNLNGSIYLPSYISTFNAYITWISFNENLITNNGMVLPNGYYDLDNWVTQTTNLGFIIDQSGEQMSGVIKNIKITVLTEEERTNLLFDPISVTFNNDDSTSYNFDIVEMLYKKYDTTDLSYIASTYFNITVDTTLTEEEQKAAFLEELSTKLGLTKVVVTQNQEATFVTENTDSSLAPLLQGVTNLTQSGVPNEVVSLIYNVSYVFTDGTVVKYKLFNINTGEAEVTLVDLTNSLRVPFDIYSAYMTEYSEVDGYNVYNQYKNRFQLVSKFDGVSIDYIVSPENSNYVRLETDSNGNKYIAIIRDNVPADTHTVTITAKVSGVDDPIYLPFTCVGVLHNVTSRNHAEFEDGKLYIELLNKFDKNHDLVLTDLEAKNNPDTTLSITGKNITSLKGLKYFTSITNLDLSNNKIVNIDDLASLKNLTNLNLYKNNITSLKSLEYLDNLSVLNLSDNQISSIEPLQYLTNLTNLDVSINNIADFRYISLLTNLNVLKVYNNTISGKYTVDIETWGSNQSGMTEVIRGNQYYFNLLKFNDANLNLYIKDASTVYNFNAAQYADEANVLSQITPIYQTSDTITLPTYISVNNSSYEITYFTNVYNDYIHITRNNNFRVTNITLTQLPIDNKVIIYANTVGLAGSYFYRPLEFYIRQGYSNAEHYGEIEVASNHWMKANNVVKDTTLLAALWIEYDANLDGKITYSELNPVIGVELSLDSANISSLDGIEYFGNIVSLNVRSNNFVDDNNDGYADIFKLGYLQNLKTLYLSGQKFNFDELLNYTRLSGGSSFVNYADEVVTLTDINDQSFTVNLRHGLTTLENLYVNGSQELNEYEQKTKLYHVYLNNPTLGTSTGEGNNKVYYGIYKDSQTELWNPLTEEISKFLGSITTSAKFINYNDEIQIKKSYDIYLYDDLIPTTFNLSSGTISANEYIFAGGSAGNQPNDAKYIKIFDAGVTGNELRGVDTTFLDKSNYILSSYFNIDTEDSTDIKITYKRLVYKDYQAYLNMTLSADSLVQGRRTLDDSNKNFRYYMTLFMQYNNDYVFESTDLEANGKSLNAIFGAVESMLFVMNSLSEELRTGERGYNYTVTLDNGSIVPHTSLEDNPEVAINYTVTEDEVTEYTGAFDTVAAYDTSLYFFIHGNFMPTAKSAVDGLRFLPQIKKVYFRRDAVLGTGKDLINVEELFLVYTFFDIHEFNTVLENLKILILAQSTGTNLSDETSLDSDPNHLKETYLVYLPNLVEFFNNGEGDNGKGEMYEWSAFLAYSYIPLGQIFDFNETTNTLNPTKYYSLNNTVEMVGGMPLDSDQRYYWFDDTDEEYDNFHPVYYKSSNGYVILNHTTMTSNISTIFAKNVAGTYYTNLYEFPDGDNLKVENQLFRHVKFGTASLNNFKLLGEAQNYSNTYYNQLVLVELYNNLPEETPTHYYLKSDSNAGDGRDFDPSFSNIVFETDVTKEYDELAPTVSNLHVKLTGETFDGEILNGTEYSDLSWENTDYSDYFRQGLIVQLPTTFDDYKTGVASIDRYRNFKITWYVSYYVYSENTQTPKSVIQKAQVQLNDSNGTFINTSTYEDILTVINNSNNKLQFELNYSGYYLFEGLLELSYDGVSYAYNTSYNKNFLLEHAKAAVYALYPNQDQYYYMDRILGSVSLIYPISITSMTDANISTYSNNGTKSINSMTKICNDTLVMNYQSKTVTNPYKLKWFDTIIDRTFKFTIFLNYAVNNNNNVTVDSDISYNLLTYSNDKSLYNTFDKIVKGILSIETGDWLSPSGSITNSNPEGKIYKYTDKSKGINSKNAVKTFAGLRRMISEIYTLDGWETLNLTSFTYESAIAVSYIPDRLPVKLTTLKISCTQGMTYFGGVFKSNVTVAYLNYVQNGLYDNTNSSDNNFNLAVGDTVIELSDYLEETDHLKMTELWCGELTEDSFVLLSKISQNGIDSSKLKVVAGLYSASKGVYTFYNHSTVTGILNNINESKLEIKLFNSIDLVDTLSNLNDYYKDLGILQTISSSEYYDTSTITLDAGYTIETPASDSQSDSSPDFALGKETYVLGIKYFANNVGLRIYSEEFNGISEPNPQNQYNIKIATFKSTKGNNGIIEGTTLSNYRYTTDDLDIYDISNFDFNWIKYLINLMSKDRGGTAPGKGSNVIINNYSTSVRVLEGYQYHNGNNYEYGLGYTNPRSSNGYTIIYDTQLSKGDNIYYYILNTKYFSFEYNNNVGSVYSTSYTTIDMKGWDKLPFTAITIGNTSTVFTVKKIINSGGTVANPKINYFGIGINWTNTSIGFKNPSVITDISGFDKSLVDGATIYIGHRIKVQQKNVVYNPITGLQLKTTKNFNTTFEYSKMHTLNYNGDYDTSFNYMYLKQEIKKSILNNNPTIFKNAYDLLWVTNNNILSLCTGGLSNITMFTNNMNHPFVNENSILFEDSVYSYYLKNKNTEKLGAIYFGTKYDSSKIIGTLINMNSDRVRTLSNNNYISILDDTTNGHVQVDETVRYSLTEGSTLKLPHYDSDGNSIVYYAVTTYNPANGDAVFILSASGFRSGNYANKLTASYSDNDLFIFKEYESYWEICLKEGHKLYMEMNYQFAIYRDKKTWTADGEFTNKQLYSNRINKNYAPTYFYVDVNYIPNIGHYIVKGDDPLYLPNKLTILGRECTLSYEVVSSTYRNYFNVTNNGTYYTYALSNRAVTTKNVKIRCTFTTTKYVYGTRNVEIYVETTTFVNGTTYYYYDEDDEEWKTTTKQNKFNSLKNAGITLYYIETQQVADYHYGEYTGTFSFFVDIASGGKPTPSTKESITSSDYYVEILVDSNGNHVSGSLIYDSNGNYIDGDYVDSTGNPKSGYEWKIVRANTIFESGLLLTDMFYSGAISLGNSAYTRHDSVNETVYQNVAYFPKYVIVNSNGEFVLNGGNLITYANDQKETAAAAVSEGGTYAGLDYHLALIYTKEQIGNIHYFSNTAMKDSVDFRAQSVLNGLEIFPLTHVRFGYYNTNFSWNGGNSRAFPGNTYSCLKDMKLEEFVMAFKHTSIYISDWTFLFNSRDTLTNFIYGGIKTNHGETYGTTHDDFSFLLSFDNLEQVIIYGLPGIQDTQSFKYFVNMMYLKHNSNIVRYFYNANDANYYEYTGLFTGISADITNASTILNNFTTVDATTNRNTLSDFTYQNGYELYLGDNSSYYSNIVNYDSLDSTTQYLLPSYINDGGTYYKLTYDSLSNFAEVVAITKTTSAELSMLQYQEAYAAYVYYCLSNNLEINDYEFANQYNIYVRFTNLANCLTDRIMISAKIECQSKMESKDDILAIDLSSQTLKDNYVAGTGYTDIYYDGEKYVYTPYTYQRFLSIYVDHTAIN